MKYLLLSLFAGVFSLYVHGVDNLRLPDVRSVGMGGNVATQSILFNPALIVDKDKKSIHLGLFVGTFILFFNICVLKLNKA